MTREEAIRHLKDILYENKTVKHSNMVIFEQEKEALRMAIKTLECEPYDDRQPKTGHWISGEKVPIKCDRCGYGVMPWNNTEYCPNCGAKMEEVNK